MEREIDLFGNPVRAGHGAKGRPRYEPTQKDHNKVKLLLAMGWGNQRIANALSVSLATLKRYFRADLKVRDIQRDQLDARRYEVVAEAALVDRNVGALKLFGTMLEASDRFHIERRMTEAQDEKPETAQRVGKKDAASAAAAEAGSGTEWGDDLSFPVRVQH